MEEQTIKDQIERLRKLSEMLDNMDDDDDDDPPIDFIRQLDDTLKSISEDVQFKLKDEEDHSIKVKIKKLYPDSKFTVTDNKIDLFIHKVKSNSEYEYVATTGIEIKIPKNFLGLIVPFHERIIHDNIEPFKVSVVGFLHSSDEGELEISIKKIHSFEYFTATTSNKIAQLILIPYPEITIIEEI